MITINNITSTSIDVCINSAWDGTGSAEWYTIPSRGSETWTRAFDTRGYVMAIGKDISRSYWLLGGEADISVSDGSPDGGFSPYTVIRMKDKYVFPALGQ